MKREKELAKNTFIISIGTILPKLASLIILPIITAELTKTEYGTYDLIQTLVQLVLPVVTLQIQSAGFRFLIDIRDKDREKREVISSIFAFIVPVSLFALIILFFCLSSIPWTTRFLILAYFLADILIMVTQQIVRGLSYNKLYSANACIHSLVNLGLIVWTVKYGKYGLNGVMVSAIVSTLAGAIYMFFRAKLYNFISVRAFSSYKLKEMLGYSWPVIPTSLSLWVLSTSDRLVLTIFKGIETVAVYAAANKIPALVAIVQSTFTYAWQESASLAVKDNDSSEYYTKMFDRIYCFISGATAVLIGLTPLLFKMLIKGDYAEAYPQISILFMGIFFATISSFLGGIYVAHKRTKNVGITTMLAAVCNLIIDLALVRFIGIYAASISTLISYLILVIYRMHNIKTFQAITYKHNKIVCYIAILAGMCVICWLNKSLLNVMNFILGMVFMTLANKALVRKIYIFVGSNLRHGRA